MSSQAPESNPDDSHHLSAWTAFEREQIWSDETVTQIVAHELTHVRQQFLTKLLAHQAINLGSGWAIFTMEPEGSLAEIGSKDVLLKSMVAMSDDGVYSIPILRVITNEPYITGEHHTYLSEDVTISPDDEAAYFMSMVTLDTYDSTQNGRTLKESSAPLFFPANGQLVIAGGVPDFTPIAPINCDIDPEILTYPFGEPLSPIDQLYALDKARGILDAIAALEPSYQYEK